VDQEEQGTGPGSPPSLEEYIVAFVRVEQRNARLAGAVRLDTVNGKEGPLRKGTVVAISNIRRGSGEEREDEVTSIQWTLWGKLADNAAEYLSKGSRVNVVGRVQNNNYQDAEGETVYALTFTCEELDYLDSRADAEAKRARQDGATRTPKPVAHTKGSSGARTAGKPANSGAKASQAADDDIPF
jgi:single-strand DNA-binding protein